MENWASEARYFARSSILRLNQEQITIDRSVNRRRAWIPFCLNGNLLWNGNLFQPQDMMDILHATTSVIDYQSSELCVLQTTQAIIYIDAWCAWQLGRSIIRKWEGSWRVFLVVQGGRPKFIMCVCWGYWFCESGDAILLFTFKVPLSITMYASLYGCERI